MSPERDALDHFGRLLVENLHDRAIDDFDLLAKGEWKAPALEELQQGLASLPPEQLAIVRRTVRRVIESGIHDFLFALQEEHDNEGRVQITVDDEDIAAISDGLHGEPYSEEGWYARFSRFGEPPEVA